jgi:hypothetical protein
VNAATRPEAGGNVIDTANVYTNGRLQRTKSFRRLRQCSTVLFPQPDGSSLAPSSWWDWEHLRFGFLDLDAVVFPFCRDLEIVGSVLWHSASVGKRKDRKQPDDKE